MRKLPQLIRLAPATALLLVAASGCAPQAPALAPVHGRVCYRGTPLYTGTIVFAPHGLRGTSGSLARGDIQPDGTYVLHTEGSSGAVVGWHRVTVVALEPT